MGLAEAVLSGVVQGVTEFFPISSSGHLVLLHSLFGIREPQVAFDVTLHIGTLTAVCIFFRKDMIALFGRDRRLLGLLIAASLPTFMIGLVFRDAFESFFGRPRVVGYMLILTGLWLSAASGYAYIKRYVPPKKPGILNSLLVGVAQGISIMPGISRSGSTIATGMLAGLSREEAFRFSFLLSVPAVLAAGVFKMNGIAAGFSGRESLSFLAGGVTALLVGLAAIKIFENALKKNLLYPFGIYCLIAGSAVVVLSKT
jgi:undecaprenyl-diphosphatase